MHTADVRFQGFVSSLVAIGAARLATCLPALGSDQARRLMAEVADDLCVQFARTELYIPAGIAGKRAVRDVGMRRQYAEDGPGGVQRGTAARAAQLARQHNLSVRRVRAILAAGCASAADGAQHKGSGNAPRA